MLLYSKIDSLGVSIKESLTKELNQFASFKISRIMLFKAFFLCRKLQKNPYQKMIFTLC